MIFELVCLPVRALIAWCAYRVAPPLLGVIAVLIGLGFFTLWGLGLRMNAPESSKFTTRTGKRVPLTWWNWARPIHGALWLGYGILALNGWSRAWTLLALDVVLGAVIKFL
jgi:hypothetical protein